MIGMIVVAVKVASGEESEAARLAKSILQELEGQILNKPALFERTE